MQEPCASTMSAAGGTRSMGPACHTAGRSKLHTRPARSQHSGSGEGARRLHGLEGQAAQVAEQAGSTPGRSSRRSRRQRWKPPRKLVLSARSMRGGRSSPPASRRNPRLSNEMATQDVADALNAGCARTTSELKVVMKAKRPSGKVQLSWRCSSRRRQTRQSERKAEQRRHPRSRRSAEVKLGKGLGGIVSMTRFIR
jgi:hypothetical protein